MEASINDHGFPANEMGRGRSGGTDGRDPWRTASFSLARSLVRAISITARAPDARDIDG
jgi:hypothetical protein